MSTHWNLMSMKALTKLLDHLMSERVTRESHHDSGVLIGSIRYKNANDKVRRLFDQLKRILQLA